jgi:3-deoxy-D-manno-octulosonic-acid transferase
VCGSTGPGEEQIILREFRALLKDFPHLRLVIVPRKPERFDEVANLIEKSGFKLVRRSIRTAQSALRSSPVVLGDTMGELRKFYSLADVVFVGRSLVDLGPRQHGSDMIEPAALAKPVVVGPFTGNFDQAVRALRAADAIIEVPDGASLRDRIHGLLSSPAKAREMGLRAQLVVRQQQGATARHVSVILEHLKAKSAS